MITGGAGFIGTTLAGRLVDANEIVALANLHRDTLGGTNLAEHPNFSFAQVDVLDQAELREHMAGATHVVHCAGIAGVDEPDLSAALDGAAMLRHPRRCPDRGGRSVDDG